MQQYGHQKTHPKKKIGNCQIPKFVTLLNLCDILMKNYMEPLSNYCLMIF